MNSYFWSWYGYYTPINLSHISVPIVALIIKLCNYTPIPPRLPDVEERQQCVILLILSTQHDEQYIVGTLNIYLMNKYINKQMTEWIHRKK